MLPKSGTRYQQWDVVPKMITCYKKWKQNGKKNDNMLPKMGK